MTNKRQQTMSPKEKAQELFDKFALGGWGKEHANSCVDEILDVIKLMSYGIRYLSARDYFQEVKQEIENL